MSAAIGKYWLLLCAFASFGLPLFVSAAEPDNSSVKVVREDNGQALQDAIVHIVPLNAEKQKSIGYH